MAINYTVSYSFSPNTTISSSQVNTNFSDNANTWTGLEAKTKSFSALQIDATPSAAADVVRKDYVDNYAGYRRPVLQYSSGTVVNIETGINGTSGQARVLFSDGNLRTDSSSGRINCNIGQVAALSGSAQSGLRTGSATQDTWYAVYAVKTTDNTANFVTVADTVLPLQSNYSTLNSNFGTNGWVYLGLIRYGDQSGALTAIQKFTQCGNLTIFQNAAANAGVKAGRGTVMATASSAASLTYTYSAGTSGQTVPNNVTNVIWTVGYSVGSTGSVTFQDSATTFYYGESSNVSGESIVMIMGTPNDGIKVAGPAASAAVIFLSGFFDGVLGVGANPIL